MEILVGCFSALIILIFSIFIWLLRSSLKRQDNMQEELQKLTLSVVKLRITCKSYFRRCNNSKFQSGGDVCSTNMGQLK